MRRAPAPKWWNRATPLAQPRPYRPSRRDQRDDGTFELTGLVLLTVPAYGSGVLE
jgi:hypothetical protein